MQGISSVYQTDSTEDATTIAVITMQREVIGGVEVYTQDAEFEVENLDELVYVPVMHCT
jgi:hypothetical protein